jgi:O-antigen/teichoic acid export membrane protein
MYAAQNHSREFRRLSIRLLLIGLALGTSGVLVALAFGRQILMLLYGQEYADHHLLFVWLTVAAAVSYMASFGGVSLTAARHFQVQLPLFAFLGLLTLGLCYAFVQSDGAVGAAKALAVAGLVQLVATLAILRYFERRRPAGVS